MSEDEPRRSNWTDATAVSLPPCPKCAEMNLPGRAPAIEIIGTHYHCSLCAYSWPVQGAS